MSPRNDPPLKLTQQPLEYLAVTSFRNEFLAMFQLVEAKVDRIERTVTEKMPVAAKILAKERMLQECKKATAKVQKSIRRINAGDPVKVEIAVIGGMLPLDSLEDLNALEALLATQNYVDALLKIIRKMKDSKGGMKSVFKGIFTDSLLDLYNFDGKLKKLALFPLKIINVVFEAYVTVPKDELIREMKKQIALSHNRYKPVRRKLSKNAIEHRQDEQPELETHELEEMEVIEEQKEA